MRGKRWQRKQGNHLMGRKEEKERRKFGLSVKQTGEAFSSHVSAVK
jgi:hypothetical protein